MVEGWHAKNPRTSRRILPPRANGWCIRRSLFYGRLRCDLGKGNAPPSWESCHVESSPGDMTVGLGCLGSTSIDPEIEIKCPSTTPPLLSSVRCVANFFRSSICYCNSLPLSPKITFISRVIYLFARDTMPAPNHSSLESNRVGVFASSFPCAARKDLSMILAGRRVERRKTVPRRRRRGTGEGVGEGGERLSEEDRAKGIILIAPDFLSSPLCDPRVRFLIHPLPRPPLVLAPLPSPPHSPPRTDGSKSFLRLIFPSNLHAAVIKGLGAQYIIRRFADATVKGGWFHRGAGRTGLLRNNGGCLEW